MDVKTNRAATLFCLILIADLVSVYGPAVVLAIFNLLIPAVGEPLPEMYVLSGKLTLAGKWLLPIVLVLVACFTIKSRPFLALFSFIAYLFFVYVGASLWPVPAYTAEFQEFTDKVIAESAPIDPNVGAWTFSHPYWFSVLFYISAGACISYVLYKRSTGALHN
jgi:hypothetical protein